MTCAQNRFRYGRMEYDTPSRFIKDFDPTLIRVLSEKGGDEDTYLRNRRQTTSRGSDWMQNPRPVATQFRADPMPRMVAPRQPEPPVKPFVNKTADSGDGLREGSVIEHQRFGIGTVVRLEGSGENLKATVTFRNLGTKQLLLKFARYKIVTR
jgi:DNA helicase-2/ATP-dependent DNA helicase PcrA